MNLKSYALSVTAVIIISAVSDMLMTEGRTKDAVRMVFALITTLTFMTPIIQFVKSDFHFEDVVQTDSMQVDYSFSEYANSVREMQIEKNVISFIEKYGIEGASVDCESEFDGEVSQLKIIKINLSNSVMKENYPHINKNELGNRVAEFLQIDEGRVVIVG